MSIPKIIAIGAGVVIIIVGGSLILKNGNKNIDSEGSLLKDYQELLQETKDPSVKNNLANSCDNPQSFQNKINGLENKLADLQARKNNLINNSVPPLPEITEINDGSEPLELSDGEYFDDSTPVPGSEPLELSDGDYSDGTTPTPGSEPLDLSDGDYFDDSTPIPGSEPLEISDWVDYANSMANQLGSEQLDLSDGDYFDGSTPIPGSEPLDLSDGDYFDDSTPVPGSEPLELSDGDYSDGTTPAPGSEPLDLSDGDYSNESPTMKEINEIESQIVLELNNLKSLCDDEEKEIISDSCQEACQKYKKCASYSDATAEDLQDAYDTCFEECGTWSKETVICMNKKPIRVPNDCLNITRCGLPEYGGYIPD